MSSVMQSGVSVGEGGGGRVWCDNSDTLTCAGKLYGYEMNVQYKCREEMKGMRRGVQ